MKKQYEYLGTVKWNASKRIFEGDNPKILEWVRKEIGKRISELRTNDTYLYRSIEIKGSYFEYFVDSSFKVFRRRIGQSEKSDNVCPICGGCFGTHRSQCPNDPLTRIKV
jgi:hypothetical protein